MLLRLLKLPSSAFREGEIYGFRVTRNPIAWIPFFLALSIGLLVWLLFIVGYVLLSPIILVWHYLHRRSFARKAGLFSDLGIHFPRAYGRLTIAWPDIREVVREHQPKVIYYRIVCGGDVKEFREYIMSSTPDDEAFERTLHERHIPFIVHDYRDVNEPVA